jgi:hypothetical protein
MVLAPFATPNVHGDDKATLGCKQAAATQKTTLTTAGKVTLSDPKLQEPAVKLLADINPLLATE